MSDRISEMFDAAIDSARHLETEMLLLSKVLREAPQPLVLGTAENWLLVGSNFAERLGYTPEELREIPWQTLVANQHTVDATEVLMDELKAEERHLMTYRSRHGHFVTVEWSWSAPDEHGLSVAMGRYR